MCVCVIRIDKNKEGGKINVKVTHFGNRRRRPSFAKSVIVVIDGYQQPVTEVVVARASHSTVAPSISLLLVYTARPNLRKALRAWTRLCVCVCVCRRTAEIRELGMRRSLSRLEKRGKGETSGWEKSGKIFPSW